MRASWLRHAAVILVASADVCVPRPACAQDALPPDANPYCPVMPEEPVDPQTVRADLDFAAGMQRHHQGAVTMSRDYLDDQRGTNPILRKMANGIIANQRLEIAMLDVVRRHAAAEPDRA